MIKGYFIDKDNCSYTLDTADNTFSSPTWVVHPDDNYAEWEDVEIDFDEDDFDWENSDYEEDYEDLDPTDLILELLKFD